MSFTEFNAIQQMILAAAVKLGGKQASIVREDTPLYGGESLGDTLRPTRCPYSSYDQVPRQPTCPRIVHEQYATRDRA